jgi:hypothetical protein
MVVMVVMVTVVVMVVMVVMVFMMVFVVMVMMITIRVCIFEYWSRHHYTDHGYGSYYSNYSKSVFALDK